MPTTKVGRTTATAASRPGQRVIARWAVLSQALAACCALAGCGGSHASHGAPAGPGAPAGQGASASAPIGTGGAGIAAFSWLHPGPPPAGWRHQSIQAGHATLAYPPTWSAIRGDPGSATALLHTDRVYHAYVNATPRQDGERLHGWATFRLAFERKEGGTHVAAVASAENLAFRGGRGSCVIDEYNARVQPHSRYREIACYVVGPHASTVVIGAAPLNEWRQRSAVLEQAVSAFSES
jgi:hypothetical protein